MLYHLIRINVVHNPITSSLYSQEKYNGGITPTPIVSGMTYVEGGNIDFISGGQIDFVA